MLFQNLLIERIIKVSLAQTWPIFFFLIFAYKLLKRAKNRSTITLSTFFFMLATAYLFPIFSILSINSPFYYAFYITSWFFLTFSQGFLILFSWLLLNIENSISFKKYFLFIALYGVIATFICWIGIFHGIQYDMSTGWRPAFSWPFAIINWIYIIFFLVIPEIFMSFTLLKIFKGSKIVIRIKLFLLSTYIEYFVTCLLVLYNTLLDNQIYHLIHVFIAFPLTILGAYFIYRSFGKNIDS